MANNQQQYRFSRGKYGYVTFDSKGYIVEAKGFGSLMCTFSQDIDKDLIGMHVDKLAEMLRINGTSFDVYPNFEIQVHLELLKAILYDLNH